LRTLAVTLFALAVLGQIVTGAALASLASGIGPRGRRPPLSFAIHAGLASFFPLLGIGVVAVLAEGSIVAFATSVSSSLNDALEPHFGDARAFFWSAVVFGVLVVLALVLGVACDLARVVVARGAAAKLTESDMPAPVRLRDAAVVALRTARRSLVRVTF